jgi:hypothetical protein
VHVVADDFDKVSRHNDSFLLVDLLIFRPALWSTIVLAFCFVSAGRYIQTRVSIKPPENNIGFFALAFSVTGYCDAPWQDQKVVTMKGCDIQSVHVQAV